MSDLTERAKALADEATPGPWRTETDNKSIVRSRAGYLAAVMTTQLNPRSGGGVLESSLADVRFIAASRELVPALVAEVEKLEGVINDMQVIISATGPERYADLVGRNEQLQAELADLHEYTATLEGADDRAAEARHQLLGWKAERERLVAALRDLDRWAGSMPDAMFTNQDPRWDWWHKRPRVDTLLASLEDSPR